MKMRFLSEEDGFERHTCKGRKEGDWVIFECPDCNYVRKWNLKTDEMKVVDRGNESALHSGFIEPTGLQLDKLSPN
jgi:hypothetical protein